MVRKSIRSMCYLKDISDRIIAYKSNKLNILNQTRILSAQTKAFFNFTKCLRRYSKTDMRVSMSERAVWKPFSSKFWLRAPSAIVFVTTA